MAVATARHMASSAKVAGVSPSGTGTILGNSVAVLDVLKQLRQVAATDSTVLLLGETGTGKELFATELHELSAGDSAGDIAPGLNTRRAVVPAVQHQSGDGNKRQQVSHVGVAKRLCRSRRLSGRRHA